MDQHTGSSFCLYEQVNGLHAEICFVWTILFFVLLHGVMQRVRLAANYHPSEEAEFFFWFMHAVTTPLHGKTTTSSPLYALSHLPSPVHGKTPGLLYLLYVLSHLLTPLTNPTY